MMKKRRKNMGIFDIFKKKAPEPEEEWVNPIPKVNRDDLPKYVWDMKTAYVDTNNAFDKMVKDIDFLENDDYSMKKKEILEDYMPGDRIYKYQTEYIDCEIDEDGNVSCDGTVIGTLPQAKVKAIKKSQEDFRKVYFEIVGGKYKKVYDDDVETEDDGYSVMVTYEVKRKRS